MNKQLVFLLIALTALCGTMHAQQKSSEIEISLLTASPGEELFSVFGHSALRVKNITTGEDIVFNYGLFSFNDPDFYLNFIRGRLDYWLGTETYLDFFVSYASENRGIQEQVFEMDSIQKQFMIHFLANNLKPENKYYPYHFFEDNCATRIRDLVLLTYNGIELPVAKENISYRELVHQYLNNRSWAKLGIDLVLGVSTDKNTGTYEQMFLPDYLFDALNNTEYNGNKIINETRTIYVPEQQQWQPSQPISPQFVFYCILALSILFCFLKKGGKIFDFTLFFLVGITGCIILLLWFFSDHPDLRANYNIIWAIPFHAIIAFFLLSGKNHNLLKWYFLVTLIMNILLLATWMLLPQKLNPALIPLIIGLSIRALWIFRTNSKKARLLK